MKGNKEAVRMRKAMNSMVGERANFLMVIEGEVVLWEEVELRRQRKAMLDEYFNLFEWWLARWLYYI